MTGQRYDSGTVLIYVFMVLVTLVVITGVFIYMTSVRLKNAGFGVTEAKALWIAEGGLENYMYLLKTDSDYRDDYPDLSDSLGEGTYLVEADYDEETSAYALTSTGTAGYLSRTIERSVIVGMGVPEAFSYAMHSGNNIDFQDSQGSLEGDISAAGSVKNEGDMSIEGGITEGSAVTMPVVNYSSYESEADHVENGTKTFEENQTYSGIWYVKKKVTFEAKVTLNGTVIAEKDISLKDAEGITITSSSNYPALVAAAAIDGRNLEDSTINGLVFAEGNISLNNTEGNAYNGSIIAGGKIEMKDGGDFSVTYNEALYTEPPPYFSGDTVTVTPQDDWAEVPSG